MKYVIIGGSASGIAAATEIRKQDGKGELTVICRDRYFYSRCQLHTVASGRLPVEKICLKASSRIEDMGIRFLGGKKVIGLDTASKTVILHDGQSVSYDRLLIATGTKTFFPPLEGFEGPLSFGLRNLDDALAIKEARKTAVNFTIIGAGLVGVELAAELVKSGVKVNLVELAKHPLPLQLDQVCGDKCSKKLSESGVKLHFGVPAKALHRSPDSKPLLLELSSGEKIPTDVLICAAGVVANADFARRAGIEVRKGIIIDEHCRTNVKDVFAAGDVAEHVDTVNGISQLTAVWPTAVRQGKVAGNVMSGGTASIKINTGMKTAMSIMGTHFISLGQICTPKPQWGKLVFRNTDSRGDESIRVLYNDGKTLKSALLWGDVTNAGLYHEAIVTGRDISCDYQFLEGLDAAKRGKEAMSVL
ncbi:MAG: FAD-dependent oxidoreductase [Victivallales bacterium]|jgi:NAD(P)H-nitrite reductase large subunit